MTYPVWIWKALSAGGVILSLVVGNHFYAKHHFNKGVAACESKQEEQDNKTIPVGEELGNAVDDAEDERQDAVREIRTETRTGISYVDLERAERNAELKGIEYGRNQAIAEIRVKGGCLVAKYSNDSELFNQSRRLQREIFGAVIGPDGTPETDTMREAREGRSLSGAPGYPSPEPD